MDDRIYIMSTNKIAIIILRYAFLKGISRQYLSNDYIMDISWGKPKVGLTIPVAEIRKRYNRALSYVPSKAIKYCLALLKVTRAWYELHFKIDEPSHKYLFKIWFWNQSEIKFPLVNKCYSRVRSLFYQQ